MEDMMTCPTCSAEVEKDKMDDHNKEMHPDMEEKGDDMPAGDEGEDKM